VRKGSFFRDIKAECFAIWCKPSDLDTAHVSVLLLCNVLSQIANATRIKNAVNQRKDAQLISRSIKVVGRIANVYQTEIDGV